MPKINQEEYEVLQFLNNTKDWIVRNPDGQLWAVGGEVPRKSPFYETWKEGDGQDVSKVDVSSFLFQFIQWEDEEPYNISDLIEEYECSTEHVSRVVNERVKALGKAWSESEEKEVKDLEWAVKEIESLMTEESQSYPHDKMVEQEIVLGILNQLEVETLSPEFIEDHKESWEDLSITGYSVPVDDLQNLLVPKQIKPKELYKAITGISPFIEEVCDSSGTETFLDESVSVERIVEAVMEAVGPSEPEKPVIPQFVAEWIESRKNNYPFDVIGVYLRMNEPFANEQTREVLSWIHESELNRGSFARAWLDGYTVGEEQKYYVYLGDGQYLASEDELKEPYAKIRHQEDSGFLNYNITFTEQEIKDYDERFWPFAVKVEELEE